MIVLAIVRISGELYHDTIDIQWGIFWLQMEASTAIIAVSVTGFRTMLRTRARTEREKSEHRRGRLQSYRQRMLHRALPRSQLELSTELDNPHISGLTSTEMGSFVEISGIDDGNAVDNLPDHQLALGLITGDGPNRENGSGKEH